MPSNPVWIWDIGITFTFFAFLSREEKYDKEEKQIVQDLISPPSIYIHICTLYIYTNTHMLRLDSSDPPGVSSRPLGSHPSTPYVVRVCVCVYTHALPPVSKDIEDTDNIPISPPVKNNPPRQVTSVLHRLADPPHPRPLTTMNKLRIQARISTTCSECVRKCACWYPKTPV